MVVPHERRGREPDLEALGLQAPAHVHVVAGAQVHGIESADAGQGVAAEGHVAAGHVLGLAIVEQHLRRAAGGAGHALRHERIVGRHDVRAAGPDEGRREHRLHQIGEPVGIHADVGVGVGHDLAGGFGQADVAGRAQAAVGNVDDPDARVAPRAGARIVARPVVDDDDLDLRVGERAERREAVVDGVAGVVGADHHRHLRPRRARVGRERGLGKRLAHRRQRRFRLPRRVHQAEGPVAHGVPAAPPLVGPGKRDRAARAFGKRRADVARGDARLALEAFAHAVGAGLGEQQRALAGDVLQPREIRAQLGLAVQVDVERADVVRVDVEILGGRKVDVGEQALRRFRLHLVVELAQETFDAPLSVPADHGRRNLVAEREEERRRVRRERAHRRRRVAANPPDQGAIVEEGDVLRPGHAGHHLQAVPGRFVEQRFAGHGVRAHRVDAGFRHHREVARDLSKRRELMPGSVRFEGAVRHAPDQEAAPVHLDELA